jgi:hypothetical protein
MGTRKNIIEIRIEYRENPKKHRENRTSNKGT